MHKNNKAAVFGMAIALALGAGAAAGCSSSTGSSSASGSSASGAASTGASSASTAQASADKLGSVATKDDIDKYCGNCHFQDVDNDAISSMNKDNIDAAMVESMVPSLSDNDVNAIVAYFAQIEPPAQTQTN